MKWRKNHTGGGVCDIYYPYFETEACIDKDKKTDKRISDNVSRMNEFYSELAVYASDYSRALGTGYRYFADFGISEDNSALAVTVTLRLRHRGRTISQKKLTHVWSDGVITKSDIVTA